MNIFIHRAILGLEDPQAWRGKLEIKGYRYVCRWDLTELNLYGVGKFSFQVVRCNDHLLFL